MNKPSPTLQRAPWMDTPLPHRCFARIGVTHHYRHVVGGKMVDGMTPHEVLTVPVHSISAEGTEAHGKRSVPTGALLIKTAVKDLHGNPLMWN